MKNKIHKEAIQQKLVYLLEMMGTNGKNCNKKNAVRYCEKLIELFKTSDIINYGDDKLI